MLGKVHSCAIDGLEEAIVEVEAGTSRGLPSFTIVGLLDEGAGAVPWPASLTGPPDRLRPRTYLEGQPLAVMRTVG